MDLFDQPVVDIAAAIRARKTRPSAVVDTFIRRIEAVNPSLNAMVANRFDTARAEAAQMDAALDAGLSDPPPLYGVPLTVKEFIQVKGLPNTGGLVARKGQLATSDAPIVTRLRAAGAIVLGVTNAPEVGLWTETVNRVYGRTNNPHDLRRTPGGSSGGEAALVAAGASPVGIGTDIGGSVRLPAFCCGLFAHKPTAGLVPNVGYFPPVHGEAGLLHTAGPIARSARDLTLLLDVLIGPHPEDPYCTALLETDAPEDARGLRVLIVPTPGRPRVTQPIQDAVRRAGEALKSRGAHVETWTHPALRKGFDLWTAAMEEASQDQSFHDVLAQGKHISPLREAVKLPFGKSDHLLPSVVLLLLEGLFAKIPASRRKRLMTQLNELRDALEEALGDNGVLLFPPYTRTAPRHKHMLLRPFDFACTGLFNALYLPVTQVPTGRAPDGMPIGVQVVSRRGADRRTLRVAEWLEADLGGWVRPSTRTP